MQRLDGGEVLQSLAVRSLPHDPVAAQNVLVDRATTGAASGASRALMRDVRDESGGTVAAIEQVSEVEAIAQVHSMLRTKKLKKKVTRVLSNGERFYGRPYIAESLGVHVRDTLLATRDDVFSDVEANCVRKLRRWLVAGVAVSDSRSAVSAAVEAQRMLRWGGLMAVLKADANAC